MKIVRVEYLIQTGAFPHSNEWKSIYRDIKGVRLFFQDEARGGGQRWRSQSLYAGRRKYDVLHVGTIKTKGPYFDVQR